MATSDDLAGALMGVAKALQDMADAFGPGDKWMDDPHVDSDWGQYGDGLVIDVTPTPVDDVKLIGDGGEDA